MGITAENNGGDVSTTNRRIAAEAELFDASVAVHRTRWSPSGSGAGGRQERAIVDNLRAASCTNTNRQGMRAGGPAGTCRLQRRGTDGCVHRVCAPAARPEHAAYKGEVPTDVSTEYARRRPGRNMPPLPPAAAAVHAPLGRAARRARSRRVDERAVYTLVLEPHAAAAARPAAEILLQLAHVLSQRGEHLGHWAMRGPYSAGLTEDLLDSKERGGGDPAADISDGDRELAQRVRSLVGDVDDPLESELYASVWFLAPARRLSDSDRAHIRESMRRAKPHFAKERVGEALGAIEAFRAGSGAAPQGSAG